MGMVEVKTADLIGPALDWAVAKADGYEPLVFPTGRDEYSVVVILAVDDGPKGFACRYSTDWSQGGPMIEKLRIDLSSPPTDTSRAGWDARVDDGRTLFWSNGGTALIAACRAIVAAKLGGVVSVPAELVGAQR